jgi:hypothetical protein
VEDEVDWLVDADRLGHVVRHERERLVTDVLDVREGAADQVVDAEHTVPSLEQVVAKVRAEEAGSSRN